MGRPKITQVADWKARATAEYVRTGNFSKAATAAGMSRTALRGKCRSDEQFDRAMKEALETYADNLEEELVRMGIERRNPLALFGRLKAERPDRWHDKLQQNIGVAVQANLQVTPEALQKMLDEAFRDITPETRAILVPKNDNPDPAQVNPA